MNISLYRKFCILGLNIHNCFIHELSFHLMTQILLYSKSDLSSRLVNHMYWHVMRCSWQAMQYQAYVFHLSSISLYYGFIKFVTTLHERQRESVCARVGHTGANCKISCQKESLSFQFYQILIDFRISLIQILSLIYIKNMEHNLELQSDPSNI